MKTFIIKDIDIWRHKPKKTCKSYIALKRRFKDDKILNIKDLLNCDDITIYDISVIEQNIPGFFQVKEIKKVCFELYKHFIIPHPTLDIFVDNFKNNKNLSNLIPQIENLYLFFKGIDINMEKICQIAIWFSINKEFDIFDLCEISQLGIKILGEKEIKIQNNIVLEYII